ncbi:hypothetical protein ACIQYW_26090 [Rhodococcus erythropolis]|jgi:hypothetical protein|uniref:hypothetical protein n=1 Tax=Rhodococcus baikonurensis TaxID=172041 RepID=UPI00339A681F
MKVDIAELSVLRSFVAPDGNPSSEVKAPKGVGRGFRCLFREFDNAHGGAVANVQSLIDFRQKLPQAERATLDALFLWPLALVESEGHTVGYLTAVVKPRFEERVRTPHSGEVTVPRTLDWLNNPDHARAVGASVVVESHDIILRVAYCAQIARAIHFVHSRGVVFGDIGPLQVVTSDSPIDVMLVGTEFMRVAGFSGEQQRVHSVGMCPPECARGQTVHDIGTDRFKLAALFRRILGEAEESPAPLFSLGARIDNEGIGMFDRGLGTDPHARPSAFEWYSYLYSQTVSHSAPPVIEMFEVLPEHGLRYQSIEVTWRVRGHRRLSLESPWGEVHALGIGASRHRLTLKQSGQFRLVASNGHGTTEQSTDIVYAFDPPAVRFVEVPELGDIATAMTGLDSTFLAKQVVQGPEFNWLDGSFGAVALPELPRLPELPQFDSVEVPLRQIDWEGLTSVVDHAMRTAEKEARYGNAGLLLLRRRAGVFFSRARSLVATVATARLRVRTRRRNSRRH